MPVELLRTAGAAVGRAGGAGEVAPVTDVGVPLGAPAANGRIPETISSTDAGPDLPVVHWLAETSRQSSTYETIMYSPRWRMASRAACPAALMSTGTS